MPYVGQRKPTTFRHYAAGFPVTVTPHLFVLSHLSLLRRALMLDPPSYSRRGVVRFRFLSLEFLVNFQRCNGQQFVLG